MNDVNFDIFKEKMKVSKKKETQGWNLKVAPESLKIELLIGPLKIDSENLAPEPQYQRIFKFKINNTD